MIILSRQTLLDFSTAGPIAEATPPMVVKAVMIRFLLLSYRRPLRAPNNSPATTQDINDQQISGYNSKLIMTLHVLIKLYNYSSQL
jgi:hypothetical protein